MDMDDFITVGYPFRFRHSFNRDFTDSVIHGGGIRGYSRRSAHDQLIFLSFPSRFEAEDCLDVVIILPFW